ncbi:MAG: NAD-dependent epimerase/dehydratase family protein [Thermosphaera sp.]
MSVLVTGGCGYLGLYVLKRLSEEGWSVVSYDITSIDLNLLENFYRLDTKRVKFVKGDIQDVFKIAETVKKYNIEYVVHLATLLTRESEENPPRAYKVNIEGTLNLLEVSRLFDIKKFVFASSEAVYGITGEEPVHEEYPKNPVTIYGITKLAAEYLGIKYSNIYGVNFVALRYPMLYGPGAYAGGTRPINYMIEAAAKNIPATIPFVEHMKVEPLYVDDAVKAILLALKTERTPSNVYNIGIGKMYTLKEILDVIRLTYPRAEVSFGNQPGVFVYPVRGPLSIRRAREELGYTPDYDIISGVRKYAEVLARGYIS